MGYEPHIADELWALRTARRRRWDRVYRWLNGGLFLLLAVAVLFYLRFGLELVAPHFPPPAVLGAPGR